MLGVGLRVGIGGLFVAVPRLFVETQVHGLEYDARAPATYFAIMHKRDLDSIAPLPALTAHGGWRRVSRDLHFAMRADGFEPGFISRVLRSPAWLAGALYWLDVSPVLRHVGVHPVSGWQTRPSESWLRDVALAESDPLLGDVLAPQVVHALAEHVRAPEASLAGRRLSQVLTWRYMRSWSLCYGPDILRGPARRRARRRAVTTAKARLAELGDWLAQGGSLYGSPEGAFAPDGRLCPVTSGFHRLLRASPTETRVVPIALVYDFMTTGRMRLCVDLAPAIEDAPLLARAEVETRLRREWLRAARFTMTQLGAAFVVEQSHAADPVFSLDELAAAVERQARCLAAAGRNIDPHLLAPGGSRGRAERFIAYCARRGLARRAGAGRWRAEPGEMTISVAWGDVGYPTQPLAYAWNEYHEMMSVGDE